MQPETYCPLPRPVARESYKSCNNFWVFLWLGHLFAAHPVCHGLLPAPVRKMKDERKKQQ
jgi:hypothetical protein